MEIGLILTKLILLLYLIISYAGSDLNRAPWFVFVVLVYICLNVALYIFKNNKIKTALHVTVLILILVSQYRIYSLFMVVLTVNMYELAMIYSKRKVEIILLTLLPLFYLKGDYLASYLLVTALCLLIFTAVQSYTERLKRLESQADHLRKHAQSLIHRLNNNEEYLRQSEYTFKLEERNRISQEIHDHIGHAMTSALIQMEASKRMLETGNVSASRELLENAIQISKGGIDQIRATLKHMKPAKEQIGFNRIKLLAGEISSQQNLVVRVTHSGNLDVISPLQWKVLYENVSEALTNVLKYAKATTVSIDIQVLNKFIKLTVKDNGQGVGKIKRGLGILGMEERTAALDGQIIIDGSDGFSVTTLLPIENEVAHK
ncbi:MAG: sensor histidine kinase [Tuberibacillus sp.]